MKRFLPACMLAAILPLTVPAQLPLVEEHVPNPQNEPLPVHPVPTDVQLAWNRTEFYGFFHYGMNTYTGREWGYGDEDENLFAPTAVPDPEQWLRVAREAGMRGGIAVVKHHDGFCLWPTATTPHNVSSSDNPHARLTNVPRDFARGARRLGMKYGFYISPWDRNSALYGTSRYVTDVFLRQCLECAAYGSDQFEMWFDGANGGDGYYGGRRDVVKVDRSSYYDLPNLRDTVHALLPHCVMWGVGGEARWIGNESGYAGITNWATDNRLDGQDQPHAEEGSEDGWMWLPGESDAKATTRGWFHHEGEQALSPERLFRMYLETVGRNATFILNVPPGKDGLIPGHSAEALRGLGSLLRERLGRKADLTHKGCRIEASHVRQAGRGRDFLPKRMLDGKTDTYWTTDDDVRQASVTLSWSKPQTVHAVMLQEHIALGQRVRRFAIETSPDGIRWRTHAADICTTIGYKRIVPLSGSTEGWQGVDDVRYLRITLLDSKACPTLQQIGVF
ncbi:MAG: alpha-L-fucosidase [Bacteroidaceae bacterium]